MIKGLDRLARSQLADSSPAGNIAVEHSGGPANGEHVSVVPLFQAMRPAQWLKNGVIFAGLIFGGKLLEPDAVLSATAAAVWFCLLSSGFYLINDVRDIQADRQHPDKRRRPVAAGELSPRTAGVVGAMLIGVALLGSAFLGYAFLLVAVAYSALMVAYNLGLKHIVIVDVLAIAAGFVLRAVAGAVAVEVSISPWLLICTMLLALLIGFGKRRHELNLLDMAGSHRRNLDAYSQRLLNWAVAVAAAGTLVAYAVYTVDGNTSPFEHRMVPTTPIVAFAVLRYLFLIYARGQGGAPETMLITDRPLLVAVALWSLASVVLFYWGR